jgi:Steigviridae/Suoliviridae L,D-carboxypeptidase/transpeptidase
MKLVLNRNIRNPEYTAGILSINDIPFCFTLELPIVDGGHHSAILPDTYDITLVCSPKHNCIVPLLINVPGRSGIEIHCGNFVTDTLGCILVGLRDIDSKGDVLISSRLTFEFLMKKLLSVNEKHTITIYES